MKAFFDDIEIELTDGFIEAVKTLMREKMAMMQAQLTPECWTWGRATLTDLSNQHCIEMDFGSDEERPLDMPEDDNVMFTVGQKKAPPRAVPNFPLFNVLP